ncbi:MAG: AAA-like domain-containing protein [Myxacorys californica WJT36-NPBG1]|jgi:hypothetical protein|nr:AAA-like domain-containing protein [Myxacorys californica WJT36-NPBG1]
MSTDNAKRILILAANPRNSTPLDLNQEVREIDEALKLSKLRDQYDLVQRWAVRPRDMRRAVLEVKPHIVHFSGHGVGEGGLALEDGAGQAKLVSTEALAGMFKLAEQVECVLLNACYSEIQATAIAQHIPYVIGMNQAVGDRAALEFAVGFYDALGAGESIEQAFQQGCIAIEMESIPEHLTPVLIPQSSASIPDSTPAPSNELSAATRKLVAVEQPKQSSSEVTVSEVLINLNEPGGQIPLDSKFYIERPPIEARCYETIDKPGALIRIRAPQQMGKSSLMVRILNHAANQGCRSTSLNLWSAGAQPLSDLDQFLHWFCSRITRKLKLSDQVADYWQGAQSSNDKCTDYFKLYLLPELNQPLVLCLDEVYQVFMRPQIATDFFGLLRYWHEESKINPVWQNLRLVMIHSKEVYVPLDINQFAFNVGVPIEPPPLTRAQVEALVERHGLNWSNTEIDQLTAMVGGHPYLLRVALYHIARKEITLSELLEVAPTEEWAYAKHLRRHLLKLEEDPALMAAIKQIVAAHHPVRVKTAEAFKLASMGLVRFEGNAVEPLCDLYRQYFKERL